MIARYTEDFAIGDLKGIVGEIEVQQFFVCEKQVPPRLGRDIVFAGAERVERGVEHLQSVVGSKGVG